MDFDHFDVCRWGAFYGGGRAHVLLLDSGRGMARWREAAKELKRARGYARSKKANKKGSAGSNEI